MGLALNRMVAAGNLTDDPKYARGDREENDRCEFSIAINEGPSGGDREVPPTYLDLVIWGKRAEEASEKLRKGSNVYAEGKIEIRSYEDKDGNRRKATRMKVFFFRYLDTGRGRDDDRDDRSRDSRDSRDVRPAARDSRPPRDEGRPAPRSTDFDDLPF
jgi:single-strand DNA-binding protein